ncbi:hypothetical protein RI129_006528 [Pyrocoelia pectoralis]|uniref:Inositol-pentakisphosphate 2-kinase n=1 Tax=Pyrocoelia pectoralis TaxID=417401 RepID=A0AAN7VH41_9COLE
MDLKCTEKNLNKILTKGWLYRGEGNANVVLSLPSCHKILRIKKCNKPKTILQWFLFWIMEIFHWDIASDMQQEKRDIDFYNLIMVPLIGSCYAQPAISIETTKSDIKKLEFELSSFRPEKRKHKGLKVGMASIFVDYAFLPSTFSNFSRECVTYAVEIKPKKGFLENDGVIDKCQFCVKQYLKIKNQQIKKLSSYCPLDLFSGDREKIYRALKALISNPQNNFRIFCNGIYHYGENTSRDKFYTMLHELFECNENDLINDFCDLITQALLKTSPINLNCPDCKDTLTCNPETSLPKGCILERILTLQKLNRLGVSKYHNILKSLNKCKGNNFSYVDNLLRKINVSNEFCPRCIIERLIIGSESSIPNDLDLVPYMISAIANDLSFMITFQKIPNLDLENCDRVITVKDLPFFVNIGVFDLYPKPLSTIEKHMKVQMEMETAYILAMQ